MSGPEWDGPNPEVREEMARLRGATIDGLRALGEELARRRLDWYRREGAAVAAASGSPDPLERAYRVLLRKLGIGEREAPVVRRDGQRITFHSMNFCPTLEACRTLGLDTRTVCRHYTERAMDLLVRQVDPRLRFTRSYERIRPHAACCEETILLEEGER